MMKKVIPVLMAVCLVGCSSGTLASISMDQNGVVRNWSEFVTFNDSGVYFTNSNDELFFKEDGQEKVSLGYINFVDGKKQNIYEDWYSTSQDVYIVLGACTEFYDGRLYLLYEHQNASGGNTYELCSLNEKGEDLKSHITFEYYPNSFYITDGKIYVCTCYTDKNVDYISVYDSNFKEIETEEYDTTTTDPSYFYIVNGEIKMPDFNTVTYDYGDVRFSRKVDKIEGEENSYHITGLYDTGELHLEFEDCVVLFVNDKYFYTSVLDYTGGLTEQVYARYNLNGTLDSSIRIADQLDTGSSDLGYGQMVSLRGEDQVFGKSDKGLFTCDFESRKCEYLYEDANTDN